jgi:hypothetical protein
VSSNKRPCRSRRVMSSAPTLTSTVLVSGKRGEKLATGELSRIPVIKRTLSPNEDLTRSMK